MNERFAAAIALVRTLSDDADCHEAEAVNKAIAAALGYHLFAPTNLPYWSVSRDPNANPYDHPENADTLFELPDFVNDLKVAISVTPAEYDFNLRRRGDVWTATCHRPNGSEISVGSSRIDARAVILAALLALAAATQS